MQKLLRILTGAAIVVSAGALAQPAGAIGLPGTQTMQGAVADSGITDKVHCRPGWWHHRYRPHDGCFRRNPYYGAYDYYPGYYGPGVGIYTPGIRFGFGVGPRHRRHW
jgi:hypothetical protein